MGEADHGEGADGHVGLGVLGQDLDGAVAVQVSDDLGPVEADMPAEKDQGVGPRALGRPAPDDVSGGVGQGGLGIPAKDRGDVAQDQGGDALAAFGDHREVPDRVGGAHDEVAVGRIVQVGGLGAQARRVDPSGAAVLGAHVGPFPCRDRTVTMSPLFRTAITAAFR